VKTGLQLRLAQHLTLTPQLQQSIRLLQLSTLELQQEIERAVAENPLLELEPPEPDVGEGIGPGDDSLVAEPGKEAALAGSDGPTWEDTEFSFAAPVDESSGSASEFSTPNAVDTGQTVMDIEVREEELPGNDLVSFDWASAGLGGDFDADEEGLEERQAKPRTLTEHLLEQVPLLRLDPDTEAVLRALIYCLNQGGWLEVTPEELGQALGLAGPVPERLWDSALAALHTMDPLGVGARDLRECLLLQLRALPLCAAREHAERMLTETYDALARAELVRVPQSFGIDGSGAGRSAPPVGTT
jgi:DNA-directed RNA polymerase specialized sigma subunit, sigma54 homolog